MKPLTETIHRLEASLLTSDVRTSYDQLNHLLADDSVEYGSSGLIYDKKDVLKSLPTAPATTCHLYDFVIIELSASLVQTRFKTDATNAHGTKLTSLRSSLWKKTGDNWRMFFHQGTPVG